MSLMVPAGFRLAACHCGIKSEPSKFDLTLVAADLDCVAAGVYTQNRVFAAPVALDRQRTPSAKMRAVVINSGNANACTGPRGWQDAQQMAQWAAEACGARPEQALVMSTGIIGEHLPMEKIAAGIQQTAAQLSDSPLALEQAARGMMTTDTRPKLAGRTLPLAGQTVQLTGLAKGAAMIGPNMATMLGLILTDASLEPERAQHILQQAVQRSFNCISVEGHTSTNDTVLMLASGAAGPPLAGADLASFQAAVEAVCMELAQAIPADGEGATHLIEITVQGCASSQAARQLAQAVANSPLVKTAVAGADPNWGRIVSAAGYAGVPFDAARLRLFVNGFLLYQDGGPVAFDESQVSDSIRHQHKTEIVLQFAEGETELRFWTCDLTADYVRLNADYHT